MSIDRIRDGDIDDPKTLAAGYLIAERWAANKF
jgi:hypothetical protein